MVAVAVTLVGGEERQMRWKRARKGSTSLQSSRLRRSSSSSTLRTCSGSRQTNADADGAGLGGCADGCPPAGGWLDEDMTGVFTLGSIVVVEPEAADGVVAAA